MPILTESSRKGLKSPFGTTRYTSDEGTFSRWPTPYRGHRELFVGGGLPSWECPKKSTKIIENTANLTFKKGTKITCSLN